MSLRVKILRGKHLNFNKVTARLQKILIFRTILLTFSIIWGTPVTMSVTALSIHFIKSKYI